MALKVLVVGSVPAGSPAAEMQRFTGACRSLGVAFAEAGFEVIVGTSSLQTADPHVVNGISDVPGRHRVHLIGPLSEQPPRIDDPTKRERVDFLLKQHRGDWYSMHVPQIAAADVVVAVAGRSGTRWTINVAPVLHRPVVLIACFGGAAREAWDIFQPLYREWNLPDEQTGPLYQSWDRSHPQRVVGLVRTLAQRARRRRAVRAPQIALVISIPILLAAWVALFVYPVQPARLTFFGMLGISALLGTGLRRALALMAESTEQQEPTGMLHLGNEVVAGLLLAFGLCLSYLAGGIVITGGFEFLDLLSSPLAFGRVAVVMTLIGLAGGLLTDQVSGKLRRWLTSVFVGAD